jgi:hypothetical protein
MSTFVLIEKYTVGAGGASSVTLGSGGTIPQTYTDLVIKASTRDTGGGTVNSNVAVQFNGNATGLSLKEVYGIGSGTGSASLSNMRIGYTAGSTATASTFGSGEIYISNYTGSNYKSSSAEGVSESNVTGAYSALEANLWSNTAAITSITLTTGTSFAQYSTFYLYGILKA